MKIPGPISYIIPMGLTLGLIACSAVAPESDVPIASDSARERKAEPFASTPSNVTESEAAIPSDVSYSIIKSTTLPGTKRSLDIRLNKKVSEATLRALALELKSQDSRSYERTFITYYLPGMTVGAGAWATTHFNPGLKVQILGLTRAEEEELVAEHTSPNRKVIGRWLDERPFGGGRFSIFHEEGRLFIEQTYKDGSALKKEVTETKSPLGRRFDTVEGSSFGDHWVLGSDGDLQLRDDEGLIATAKKIE